MDIDPYVDALRVELDAAAAAGGPEVSDAAARLARAIDPATRLVLLDAIGDAAREVELGLADHAHTLGAHVGVDVRLRGRTPALAVSLTPVEPEPVEAPAEPLADADAPSDGDGPVARVTVRLPESVKVQVEAAAARSGSSVNAWIARVLAEAVDGVWRDSGPASRAIPVPPMPPRPPSWPLPGPEPGRRGPGVGRRVQGWVR